MQPRLSHPQRPCVRIRAGGALGRDQRGLSLEEPQGAKLRLVRAEICVDVESLRLDVEMLRSRRVAVEVPYAASSGQLLL
jgi:hypothetical protein